jgi:hypothetical protein
LTTTGKPTFDATAAASSALRTISPRGTGNPADASSRRVTSLSPAMSTASALVFEVIVARIRCWYLPQPSCSSEASFKRIHGMSRLAASSTIAWVEGPNARRSASRIRRSSSAGKSKSSAGSTSWLTTRTASSPAARPTRSSQ